VLDWAQIANTQMKTWRYAEGNFNDLDTVAKLVGIMTKNECLLQSTLNSYMENINRNIMALNWILTGDFGSK
jgi:hypothetical protein